jgi:hypothetical protein
MPDGNPRYKDLPRKSSIDYFETGLKNHKVVLSYDKLKEQQYNITRIEKSDLKVYLTNLYIVSLADVHEIIDKFPSLNCIVTISNYNSYTSEAKKFCIENGIGLFNYKELYGALYYNKDRFLNYVPKERD